jgi:uncharacterized membrane protein YfcA
MEIFLFCLIVLFSNVVQGITGFAGTILAMPFSLQTAGYETAVPVLNLLGLLSGVYVLVQDPKALDRKEFRRILIWMIPFMITGILLVQVLRFHAGLLYAILGTIVILLGIQGLYFLILHKKRKPSKKEDLVLLILSAVVHGMYVCGGPLLIGYLTHRITEKERFRVTISSIWIILNGILFASHLLQGMWTLEVWKVTAIVLPFFLAGMYLGTKLSRQMSRRFFMGLTYVLLLIAGISLYLK